MLLKLFVLVVKCVIHRILVDVLIIDLSISFIEQKQRQFKKNYLEFFSLFMLTEFKWWCFYSLLVSNK